MRVRIPPPAPTLRGPFLKDQGADARSGPGHGPGRRSSGLHRGEAQQHQRRRDGLRREGRSEEDPGEARDPAESERRPGPLQQPQDEARQKERRERGEGEPSRGSLRAAVREEIEEADAGAGGGPPAEACHEGRGVEERDRRDEQQVRREGRGDGPRALPPARIHDHQEGGDQQRPVIESHRHPGQRPGADAGAAAAGGPGADERRQGEGGERAEHRPEGHRRRQQHQRERRSPPAALEATGDRGREEPEREDHDEPHVPHARRAGEPEEHGRPRREERPRREDLRRRVEPEAHGYGLAPARRALGGRRVGAAAVEEPARVGPRLDDRRVLRADDAGAVADAREDEGRHADREGGGEDGDDQPCATVDAAHGERQVQHAEPGRGRAEEEPQRVLRQRRARFRRERRREAPEPRGEAHRRRLLPRRPEERVLRHLHREPEEKEGRERDVRAAAPGENRERQHDRGRDQVVRVDDAREVERGEERRAPRGERPLRVPVAQLRTQQQQPERHEQRVEDREREVVPQARHAAEVDQVVREAEPGRPAERVVVAAGEPDVVDHDVAPEGAEVEGRNGEDDGQEDGSGGGERRKEAAPRGSAREVAEGAGPRERHEEEGSEGPGELLGGAGEAEERAPGHGPSRPGEEDSAEHHRHEDKVVRTEDLVPVDERVQGRDPRRGQPGLGRARDSGGEDDDERIEEDRDHPRVEAPEGGTGRELEGQHHEVRPRQVRVVVQDRVAAPLVPEARHPRLAGEDGVRVVRAVGAPTGEDLVDRERQLHHPSVLAVRPVGSRPHPHEGGARQHDEERRGEDDHAGARRQPGPGSGEQGVAEGEERRQRGEEERHGVAVEGAGGRGEERPQPSRGRAEDRVVREPPGQDARRVVEDEVPRQEQEQAGDDRAVDADGPVGAQAPLPPGEETGTRAPQEHTRLRTAHSIFSRRPQAGHPM